MRRPAHRCFVEGLRGSALARTAGRPAPPSDTVCRRSSRTEAAVTASNSTSADCPADDASSPLPPLLPSRCLTRLQTCSTSTNCTILNVSFHSIPFQPLGLGICILREAGDQCLFISPGLAERFKLVLARS